MMILTGSHKSSILDILPTIPEESELQENTQTPEIKVSEPAYKPIVHDLTTNIYLAYYDL